MLKTNRNQTPYVVSYNEYEFSIVLQKKRSNAVIKCSRNVVKNGKLAIKMHPTHA